MASTESPAPEGERATDLEHADTAWYWIGRLEAEIEIASRNARGPERRAEMARMASHLANIERVLTKNNYHDPA